MDREQLKELLIPFAARCSEKGKPLSDYCLIEAFPGDAATPFIVQIRAPWVEEMYCSDALELLFGILWETTDEETRRNIFTIQIMDSNDQLHCSAESEMVRK
ncbi:hypothetical protein ACFOTA_12115 [Chitinophaga sp. GCM10012297]|uniref:Uncharacterized protein n=1 Tax=Chitinophaga chungangae TaxID=2821488 RepID=A0ABS3YE63_9BACT|nr:hypothetical protein [Chitinophaga chungangae]MBO9152956.1 hypothetical protein [Chitinophaga chungangae]